MRCQQRFAIRGPKGDKALRKFRLPTASHTSLEGHYTTVTYWMVALKATVDQPIRHYMIGWCEGLSGQVFLPNSFTLFRTYAITLWVIVSPCNGPISGIQTFGSSRMNIGTPKLYLFRGVSPPCTPNEPSAELNLQPVPYP